MGFRVKVSWADGRGFRGTVEKRLGGLTRGAIMESGPGDRLYWASI